MTAMPPTVDAEKLRTARLYALTGWLRSIGCCIWCALRLALVAVEKETGGVDVPAALPCRAPEYVRDPALGHRVARAACVDVARAAWGERPRRAA